MPRPPKSRKVCGLPEFCEYGPFNNTAVMEETIMTVEEFEVIRLIDLEDLSQEECGERMGVARATVQRIYADARKKVADSIVNGKTLRIEGGNYNLCSGRMKKCAHCWKENPMPE